MFRTEKRRHPDGVAYPWIVKTTGMVNHFYFYCVDSDFGPFFLKSCSYFPYNAKLCLNGNHRAQRQATKTGLGFAPLDNAFAQVDDPVALQQICDQLGPAQIQALLNKWLAILPNPFTDADRAAGYDYDLSMLQVEFSLTQMLDTPTSGRVFFENVIRENLDVGRPDQVGLIFDRRIFRKGPRATPGRFADPGDHRRGHPEPARGLQTHHHQAVPQVATRGRTLRANSQEEGRLMMSVA